MASSKRIGFFWGEEKITFLEFEKKFPLRKVSLAFTARADSSSPFGANFSDEIEINKFFQKILHENSPLIGGPFYISLPVKDIILRSFVIPFLKPEEIKNVVKFEARKYLPIDTKDLIHVYYTFPFTEDKTKHLQVLFFALRKETLERYLRIFKQINATITFCEPCVVSLAKVLLFKKEINPTEHLAFLSLDKNIGRICFIYQGIPQYIREFPISSQSPLEETKTSPEEPNSKILNEVANSFDFYARQFSAVPVDRLLVSAEQAGEDLFQALETELKLELKKVSFSITMQGGPPSNDLDTIYAMGACVEPTIDPLSDFNFLEDKTFKLKFKGGFAGFIKAYKEILLVLLSCAVTLIGAGIFFQWQLTTAQKQYDRLFSETGSSMSLPIESMQADLQQDTDKLSQYKNIRTKSDMVFILLRLASHLPQGAVLKTLNVKYGLEDTNDAQVNIEMTGEVSKSSSYEEIKAVNRIYLDIKDDKGFSKFFKSVTFSLDLQETEGRNVTGFTISCS